MSTLKDKTRRCELVYKMRKIIDGKFENCIV